MCTQNYKSLVVDDTRHGFLSFSNNIDHNRTETVLQSPPVVDYCSGYTDFKVSHETPAFFFPLETCRMTHILFFLFFFASVWAVSRCQNCQYVHRGTIDEHFCRLDKEGTKHTYKTVKLSAQVLLTSMFLLSCQGICSEFYIPCYPGQFVIMELLKCIDSLKVIFQQLMKVFKYLCNLKKKN